jgi:5-methylcytosine-specific restriction endonuclease McrA
VSVFLKEKTPTRKFVPVAQEIIDMRPICFYKAVASSRGAWKRCNWYGTRYDSITSHLFWLLANSPTCYFCGKRFENDSEKTIDHLIPIVRGGGHVIGNVVVACHHCNQLKGYMSKIEYARVTESWRQIAGVSL